MNVRTNHVHTVVSAPCKPEKYLQLSKRMQLENYEKQVVGKVTIVRGLTAEVRNICGLNKTSLMQSLMWNTIRASPCHEVFRESEPGAVATGQRLNSTSRSSVAWPFYTTILTNS